MQASSPLIKSILIAMAIAGCGENATDKPAPSPPPGEEPITYYQHIKPILDARCGSCHRPSAIGPMPLDTYNNAKTYAGSLVDAVLTRVMPPLRAEDADCATIEDPRKMPDAERTLVERWVEQGSQEGDPNAGPAIQIDAPPDPLGLPDDTFASAQPYLPPGDAGADEYRCFIVDPKLNDFVQFVALGMHTSRPRMVHHAIVYVALPETQAAVDALDAADPLPGYPCYFGAGFDGALPLGGFSPGAIQQPLPGGTAVWLPPGARFVVEMHYAYDIEKAIDTPGVTMWRSKTVIDKVPTALHLIDTSFLIPKDDPDYRFEIVGDIVPQGTTPGPLQAEEGLIWQVGAHMHLLGKTARLDIMRQDGSKQCLLWVPNWDDHWQGGYRLASPIPVAAGDQVKLTCNWDNSQAHQPFVNGMQQQSKDTWFGLNRLDEMCVADLWMTAK